MVNILSGSVSAYRQESANQRFIRIDEVMDPLQMRMATPLPSKALMEPLMWKVQAIIQLP